MKTKKLVFISLLIGVEVLLARLFSFEVANTIRIGFAFIALAVNAALFGPVVAGFSGAIADLIGYMIKPTGMFFPGFTLSAFMTGLIYGFFLNRKELSVKNMVIASAIISMIVNLGMNTVWLTFISGAPFDKLLMTRLPVEVVQMSIKTVLLIAILPKLVGNLKNLFFKNTVNY